MIKRLLNSPLDVIADYVLLLIGCCFVGISTDKNIGFGVWCICVSMRAKA